MAKSNFNIDDYLYVDPNEIKTAILKWLATRQAQKRYSKEPDALVINEDGKYNFKGSKQLHDLSRKQNFKDEIFYKTERHLSYNNGKAQDAHCAWVIDPGPSSPKVTLVTSIHAITEYRNKAISIEINKDVIKSNAGASFQIREIRTNKEIRRAIYNEKQKEIPYIELPDDLKKQISEDEFKDTKWDLDVPNFIYIKNTPNNESDRVFIENDLNDIVTLIQKKRDDILYSSVKVVETGATSASKNKEAGNADAKAETNRKKMAASSIIMRDSTTLEGQGGAIIVNAIPNTGIYDQAIRTSLNTILKKTGGATDVDSKGTVQQSKNEVLMSQGDEFKVGEWKQGNRQAIIRELYEIIWKVFTSIQNVTTPFKDAAYVFALISQEDTISETDKLANINIAVAAGMTTKLMAFARYNKLAVVDAFILYNMKVVDNG